MYDEGPAFFIGTIAGAILAGCLVYVWTSGTYKREAIAAGVAEYRSPSPDSPERTFTWKTNLNVIVEHNK